MIRDALYQQFARIGHAASNPHRLRLLNLLCQGEKAVETLAQHLGQSVASTSAHLKVLRSACLIENRRDGRHIFYRLADEQVAEFWLALRALGERLLPEVREVVREYFDDRESMTLLSAAELREQVREGRVTLIDLRPADEYAAGHLPGARSVPLSDLKASIEGLPKRKPIVAYCRGPYCVAAVEGVQRLREAGLNAKRLPLGVAEWRAGGMSLEMAARPAQH